ncbi:TetR/AcrR family transcriptional regulator [Phyllobacterium myrsinacearum]|uniref:AcrR family transcriptional regulator n=1 Tax=Phyllobacterium myrsinacearum TaxID=28101 RepID=A0A839ELD1_9HYPH|nr:TetR/AcrR family transcriptional regulator [Phyllobacterium myrsinacearum]MBA8881313.1 AcrR family transcriptional regulator [Phyllobacterium myrsinacearum]
MGRKRTIDRGKVLDAAEAVVSKVGAAALTIDAVAKAAGITKGGVQYCFGTKGALIDAMLDRWGQDYDTEVVKLTEDTLISPIEAHLEATRRADESSNAKAASLMASLIQTPEHLGSTREWYKTRMADFDLTTEAGRRAKIAFIATEGVFMLRFFGFMEISEHDWNAIFDDIESFVLTKKEG